MDSITPGSGDDKKLDEGRLKRRSRPVLVADAIKALVVEKGLAAGDRLPSEPEMIARFGMAKGTIREAMRLLEAQGLVETKTGPGGGSFIKQVSNERARALLANYFYFQDLTVADIYQLRRLLEPELVASLAGHLDEAAIGELETIVASYSEPPKSFEDEREQHIRSLSFHAALARHAENALLGFLIDFMASILADMTIHRKLYLPSNIELWSRGRAHQIDLIAALRKGDAEAARKIMRDHMELAQAQMERQEAAIAKRFIDGHQ